MRILLTSLFLPLIGWLLMGLLAGQLPVDGSATLTLRLRHDNGTPVVGTKVQVLRFPDGLPTLPDCYSDTRGECAWPVASGLYEVRFDRSVDPVTAATVAEGGLEGLGLTVGQWDITYHFVFSAGNYVYFDAAPIAAVPVPIIPTWNDLHQATLPLTNTSHSEQVTETPIVISTPQPSDEIVPPLQKTSTSWWRLLLFIGLGVSLGSGLYYYFHCRAYHTPRRSPEQGKSNE